MHADLLPPRWPVAAGTPRTYARFAHRYVKLALPSVRSMSTSTASNVLKHAARALKSVGRWPKHLMSARLSLSGPKLPQTMNGGSLGNLEVLGRSLR
jgi:hypothetical protein